MDATTSPTVRPEPAASDQDRGFGPAIRHVFAAIRRDKWLIAGILAAAVVAAIILTMLQTPRYTAAATVEINEQTAQVLGEDLETSFETYNWDVELFLNTQLEILRSRALAERVAERLDLASSQAFFEAMEAPEFANLPEAERHAAVIALLRGNFAVNLPVRTRIAELYFGSTDPVVSAQIVNAFAAEYIQANLQRKFDSSSYARTFVAEQLQEARNRLEASERELNAYAREAGLIRTRDPLNQEASSAGSMNAASLMQLNQAANAAQAERIAAEARWRSEQAQPLFASQSVLASPTVQALMTRRADLQTELESARRRYYDDHPTVTRLETELASVQSGLDRAAREVRNAIRANYQAAASAEQQLQGQVDALQGATLAEQDRSVRYNTLAREADTNRSLYDGLLQRYRALNASSGITASNIAIVDEAEPPTIPSSPSLPRNLAVALLMGTALAGGIVFLRDQMDDRLRIPEDIEAKVGLPLLGVIPVVAEGEPRDWLDDPKSPISESYNSLRTSLLHSTRDGLPRLLLVTSAQPSEGKTTTSYAIAKSFARVGKRVLLIDADMRRPAIHKIAGIANRTGLSSVLVGETTLADAVVSTELEGLSVLTGGPIAPAPAELLSSPRMAALLEQVDATYDLVVLDSAPILGLADSTELASLVDGVVVVVEADRSRGAQLRGALRRLRATDPTIVGAVLTKYDPARSGNSYASYYGTNYYRYDSDRNAAA